LQIHLFEEPQIPAFKHLILVEILFGQYQLLTPLTNRLKRIVQQVFNGMVVYSQETGSSMNT